MNGETPENTAAKPATESSASRSKARDPMDPLGWEMPVVCKDCDKEFKVPYRHFQAGVVFHCPHCHGSYVPTLPMYRRVHDTFETFYARMRRERDESAKNGGSDAVFTNKLERELAEFHNTLERLAHELRPAGKLVRRKGLAAMFT
jgi:hypothetical protein